MNIVMTDGERAEMKRFYETELEATVKRLQHLKNVLSQLESDYKVEVVVAGKQEAIPSERKSAAKRKRKGKKGRKSIWGEFILNTLKQNDRPLKYSEIITAAKIKFNIPPSKMKVLKAAINQSAFRLRTIHKSIDTVGAEGRKEKYIALKKWYDDKGNLSNVYASKLDH